MRPQHGRQRLELSSHRSIFSVITFITLTAIIIFSQEPESLVRGQSAITPRNIFQSTNETWNSFIQAKETAVRAICEHAKSFDVSWSKEKSKYSSCVYYDACDASLSRRIPYFDCVYNFGYDFDCECKGERLSMHYAVVSFENMGV